MPSRAAGARRNALKARAWSLSSARKRSCFSRPAARMSRLRHCNRSRASLRAPRYDRAEYLPRTRERLQRLAQIVAARDVFVLLQGPSFATFAARLHESAGFEFAVATLNSF